MQIILGIFSLAGLTTPANSQHFNWTVLLTDGSLFQDVHPDTIRNDSLVLSQSENTAYRVCLDSIYSLTYDYNPTFVTLTVMGGIIGATGNSNIFDPINHHVFASGKSCLGLLSGHRSAIC